MQLSAKNRKENIDYLAQITFDLLIIGGGITGAGIALDAASRGLKVLLLEKQDFAAGTSSRSTKLIHGGLRYLKQGEFGLVREVGLERAIVHRNAPHLVLPEKMIIPLIKGGNFGKWATSFGLWVYDKLANVKDQDQRQMLTKEETLKQEPLLRQELVIGSGYYAEYRTDDARMTIEIIKKAAEYEAICLNYFKVKKFIYQQSKAVGVSAQDLLSGKSVDFRAKAIINACGPWVDELRAKDNSLQGKRLHITKGIHLVVPIEKFPVKQSVYFDVPDGRMIFAIPRHGSTYIGTTDTDYQGNKESPSISRQDVRYLLESVNHLFPSIKLQEADVISSWAGLRPLIHEEGKSASELSRKDEIFVSESGLISIAGGKLTGYRKMAQRTVDLAIERHFDKEDFPACFTESIKLTKEPFVDFEEVKASIKSWGAKIKNPLLATRMINTYGKAFSLIVKDAETLFSEKSDIAIHLAAYKYSAENEMCLNLTDFFYQKTGMMYFQPQEVAALYKEMKDAITKYGLINEEQLNIKPELALKAIVSFGS